MIALQALFSLYLEAFLEGYPDVRHTLEELSTKVGDACKEGTKENIQTAHHSSTNAIQSSEVVRRCLIFTLRMPQILSLLYFANTCAW